MRTALCLHGMMGQETRWEEKPNIGKRGATLDPFLGWKQYKRHLLDKNENVDVFLHTRDPDFDEKVIKLYQPKKHEVEPYYTLDLDKYCIASNKATKHPLDSAKNHAQRAWSRWHSAYKSVKLKSDYDKEFSWRTYKS